ncbi:DinB family protein [Novipirellula galeiformis]|uniref:DinB family protein n=1 Tax=Novipirellula galeiformis TaxID=2528004 RepID=A0A5C6CQX7_9BACT|nr:DinB family protein [Novipirellula galeiformis]TWU26758.1 DinB family protein [Novipirellula galeiformis]
MTIAELMLPELEREMAQTRKVLEKVPADQLEWKANETLHTLGWNANHLAEIVGWTKFIIDEDVFNLAPTDGPAYQTPSLDDPAKILAAFDENLLSARAALAGTSDETMAKLWTMKAGEQTLMTLSKGECLRTWVLNHTVHHRGILSVYLRMLGVDDACVYG